MYKNTEHNEQTLLHTQNKSHSTNKKVLQHDEKHYNLSRLEYIMLLKLPIILSSNSFILTKIIPSKKHPTISLIYIAMVKLQYILLIHEIQKMQRVFSVNYVVMDTSNIVLWVSVYVRNMQTLLWQHFKAIESL